MMACFTQKWGVLFWELKKKKVLKSYCWENVKKSSWKVSKPFKVMKLNLVAQKFQELNKGRTFFHVPKQLLLWCLRGGGEGQFSGGAARDFKAASSLKGTHLAKLLIDNAELEVVTDHMLVKCDNEPWCLRADRMRTFHSSSWRRTVGG